MPAMGEGPQLDLDRDVYMGHEFCAEVLDVGPDTVGPAPGTLVTSIPVLLTMSGVQAIVYSNEVAGGYGERMLLSAPMLLEVPNGLDFRHAALTEPMAVGLHAVNKSGIKPGEGALVLGCGPVGLAVIGALKLKGIDTIVATDFSPTRRALATTMGATEVVDPATEPAFDAWMRAGGGKPLVCFEAIGVPGHHRLRAARRSPQHAAGRGRRVHGDRPHQPVLRDQQGAERAVLPRLRPDGVRRHAALDRRGRARRGPAHHR